MATVLVADDDQLLRAIIRERLERAGHFVVEAGDGIAALELALEERPDALLLDVMMPLARGLEVVRQVRREVDWNPAIVMISARTRFTDRANALEAGADVYVEKPFEPETLLEILERRLAHTEPARVVDIVGPIWTGLAAHALESKQPDLPSASPVCTPTDIAQLFFRERVDAVVGRRDSERPDLTVESDLMLAAIHGIWECALDAVAGTAIEREIPTRLDVVAPDPTAAVFGHAADATLRRQRATQPVDTLTGRYWHSVVAGAVGAPEPPRHTPQLDPGRVDAQARRALRHILSALNAGEALRDGWSECLRGLQTNPDGETAQPQVVDALRVVWSRTAPVQRDPVAVTS